MKQSFTAIWTLLLLAAANAWSVDLERQLKFEIPSQPLAAALLQFSNQANIQILTAGNEISAATSPGVIGSHTIESGLKRILTGTGFVFRLSGDNTVSIVRPEHASAQSPDPAALRVAQADSPSPSQGEGQGEDKGEKDLDFPEVRGIPEILVRGSRSKSLNAEIKRSEDDIQPYVVLNSETIQRSGETDLQSLLNSQLAVATPLATGQRGSFGATSGNATAFALRGLSPEQTLILVNGRRVVSQSVQGLSTQPDLGGIPLAAIERIEVLPSTASGVFGGGATGGVINVILKQAYEGIDVSATYGSTFKSSAPNRAVTVSGGFSPDGGVTSLMLIGSYSKQDSLYARDRDFLLAARQLSAQNNPASIYGSVPPPVGHTTNICAVTSPTAFACSPNTQLVLDDGRPLGASRTYVPAGYPGLAAAKDAGAAFIANAGTFNLDPADTAQDFGGNGQSLLFAPTVKSISATVRRNFTQAIDAFAEFALSDNDAWFADNARDATYVLPASASTNPFQQAIMVTTPSYGLDGRNRSKTTTRRAVAGVSVALGDEWKVSGEYSWSRSRFTREYLPSFGTPAPGSADVVSGAIDVLRDTNQYPISFAPYAVALGDYGPAVATLKNPALRFAGALPFSTFGGRPTATVTLEYREESLSDTYDMSSASTGTLYPERSQAARSVYTELLVPLVSQRNRIAGAELLELQVAARHERFTVRTANSVAISSTVQVVERQQTFSSTDPTVGLRYQPVKQLTIRGSFGRGFFPANFTQLIPSADRRQNAAPLSLVDPLRGNQLVTGTLTISSGGNPDLRPEQAKSTSYGLIFKPTFLPGLRLSADRTKIEKRDNIDTLSSQLAINSELLLPGAVTRAAATPQNDPSGFGVGPITALNLRRRNFAKADIDALDLAASYEWVASAFGHGGITLSGTRTLNNTRQAVANAPEIDALGTISAPKWLANASLEWGLGSWSAGWQTHYYPSYWLSETHAVILSQGSAKITSQIYHDLFVGYGLGDQAQARSGGTSELLAGLNIQLGVRNVFDKEPPIVAQDPFGYSSFGDPRMARYYVNIRKSF